MKIYTLFGILPDQDIKEIYSLSKGNIQNAADTLQKKYLQGFLEQPNVSKVSVINLPYIGSYPKFYGKLFYKTQTKRQNVGKLEIRNLNFLNLIFFKNISRFFKPLIVSLFLLFNDKSSEEKLYITYAMHLPFLLTVYILSKVFPSVHFYVIVPDLPEYMAERKGLKNQLYTMFAKVSYFIVNRMDGIVVITEAMKDKFSPSPKKVLIEGIASANDFDSLDVNTITAQPSPKFLLYAGTLDKRYGVVDLVDAFNEIEIQDIYLYICGDGDSREYITQAAKQNPKIKYFGTLPRQEVLKLQLQASVLINPRKNMGEYVKYSFPSKTLEYMSSGTPVLMHKLPGIPDEYYNYIYTIGEADGSFKKALREVALLDKAALAARGLAAQKFVSLKKSPYNQVIKILQSVR